MLKHVTRNGFNKRRCIASAAGAVLFALAGPVAAAEYHRAPASHHSTGAPLDLARHHLRSSSASLGLAGVVLQPRRALSADGFTTIRFQQRYGGLPVIRGAAAARVGPEGTVLLTMIDVARGLDVDTAPTVSARQAGHVVEALMARPLPSGVRQELVVIRDGRGGRLAWTFDVPDPKGGKRYRVDAHRGRMLSIRPLAMRVLGRVYPIHPLATPTPEDRELTDLTVSDPQRLAGWDGNLVVTRFVHGGGTDPDTLEDDLGPNVGEDFLYDPPADVTDDADPFAQVNAYYHLTRARDLFAGFGVDMSGPTWKLVAAVNVLDTGQPFDGAFFSPGGLGPPWNSPNFIAFGQGHAADFAYDSDAFLHEFTHYVNYNAVNFNAGQFAFDEQGLSPFSMAIDEGVADYFACSAAGDPILGEASLATIGKTRDISDTSQRCPSDIGGEGHLDGVIIASLGWTLRDRFGREVADSLMWTAVTLLPYQATLGDFARGILERASELAGIGTLTSQDVDEVGELIRIRGLDDCDRAIQVPLGGSRKTLVFGLDSVAEVLETTCGELLSLNESLPSLFQFHSKAGGADGGIRFDVDISPVAGGALDWSIYLRANQPVSFDVGEAVPVPVVRDFDHAVTNITIDSGSIVVDGQSEPPFDPNATYYLVITHRNCPGVEATISAAAIPPEELDAGTGGDSGLDAGEGPNSASSGDVAGGCGCQSGAKQTSGFSAVLLLLGLALLRRFPRLR